MGLEIPKSHIYKKFNIPKPENGEEVLKPPQAGMMTAQQQPMETTEELKLKQEEDRQNRDRWTQSSPLLISNQRTSSGR